MSNSTNNLEELEANYIKALKEDLEAAYKDLNSSVSEVDRKRVGRKICDLKDQINRLKQISSFPPVNIVNDLISKEAFDLKNIISECRNVLLSYPSPNVHTFILNYNKGNFEDIFLSRLKKDCAFLKEETIVSRVHTVGFRSSTSFILRRINELKYKNLLNNHHLCLFIKVEDYNNNQDIVNFIDSIHSEFSTHSEKTLLLMVCSNSLIEIDNTRKNITVLPQLSFFREDIVNWINEIVTQLDWNHIMRKWVEEAYKQCRLDDKANSNILDTSLVYDYIDNIIRIFKEQTPTNAEEFWANFNN